ncbi:monovalent cation/H(+) antiporter subunit G [uncultured Draconibacterium sp.]|uniref:monovalent cation/H(+) antiporter subunit G n=1 Tax=uncultured Draconibacterium sp. TaxID=1573823 RepID=UPI0032165692
MEVLKIIGAFITLIGSFFLLLGSIGLIRMPDVFTRIQAGTKASTLGTILSLLGIGLIYLPIFGKVFLLIVFILITNPVSSHMLARAAHYIGVKKADVTVVDKLSEYYENNKTQKPELK